MITTVTLNPAIDKIYRIDDFHVHRLHRIREQERVVVSPGGKGVNVALVLHQMGLNPVAMGFAGGHTGRGLMEALHRAGLATSFVPTEQETRTDLFIIDEANATLTEVNEPGPRIQGRDLEHFRDLYGKILQQSELVVLAGSVPPGLPEDIYGDLILRGREKERKTILHAAPRFLEPALEAGPAVVVPDMRSTHVLFGREVDGVAGFVEAGRELLGRFPGVEQVMFIHRLENVVAVFAGEAYVLRPADLRIKSMLGYGDAVVAGIARGLFESAERLDSLRFACAAGLTNLEHADKLFAPLDGIRANLERIRIEEVASHA